VGQGLDRDGECPGEAKVTDFDIAFLIDKKILWLEVTVDNALGMTIVNATE